MLFYKAAYVMGAMGLSFATPVFAKDEARASVRPSDSAASFRYDSKASKKSGTDRGNHYGYDKGKGHGHGPGKGHGGGHCEEDNRCHTSPG